MICKPTINIKRNKQSISLIGVENWGKGRFKKKGDIDKACNGLNENDFKIVMSHDPSHWDEILKNHKTHFHLTLSGHTHGMQFGIEIPGFIKWSPIINRSPFYKSRNFNFKFHALRVTSKS